MRRRSLLYTFLRQTHLPGRGKVVHRPKLHVAVHTIRNAFEPLACVVELCDRQTRLSFRVFDRDGRPLVNIMRLSALDIMEPAALEAEIVKARARVQQRGFMLDVWVPPWRRKRASRMSINLAPTERI